MNRWTLERWRYQTCWLLLIHFGGFQCLSSREFGNNNRLMTLLCNSVVGDENIYIYTERRCNEPHHYQTQTNESSFFNGIRLFLERNKKKKKKTSPRHRWMVVSASTPSAAVPFKKFLIEMRFLFANKNFVPYRRFEWIIFRFFSRVAFLTVSIERLLCIHSTPAFSITDDWEMSTRTIIYVGVNQLPAVSFSLYSFSRWLHGPPTRLFIDSSRQYASEKAKPVVSSWFSFSFFFFWIDQVNMSRVYAS